MGSGEVNVSNSSQLNGRGYSSVSTVGDEIQPSTEIEVTTNVQKQRLRTTR